MASNIERCRNKLMKCMYVLNNKQSKICNELKLSFLARCAFHFIPPFVYSGDHFNYSYLLFENIYLEKEKIL